MNIENAKNEFKKYVSNFDTKNPRIKLKYEHSFRVMYRSIDIAKSLNFSNEEIQLATLIGLLHDIGSFEEATKYSSFNIKNKIDHGDLGVEILKSNNYLRNYISDCKYDNIILKSIKNHNKFAIENNLSDNELLFAKLIRDADKLDIFYEGSEMFWKDKVIKEKIENSKISNEIFKQFSEKHLINRYLCNEKIDEIVSFIAFCFDLNFDFSFKYLKEKNYINTIISRFNFRNVETKNQFKKIKEIANDYITMKGMNF